LLRAARGSRWSEPCIGAESGPAYRRLSLYARVVIVNATVLVVATMFLSLTPAYVPFPST